MTNRQKSINEMLRLTNRLNQIVAEMKIRKEAMLAEMHSKAA